MTFWSFRSVLSVPAASQYSQRPDGGTGCRESFCRQTDWTNFTTWRRECSSPRLPQGPHRPLLVFLRCSPSALSLPHTPPPSPAPAPPSSSSSLFTARQAHLLLDDELLLAALKGIKPRPELRFNFSNAASESSSRTPSTCGGRLIRQTVHIACNQTSISVELPPSRFFKMYFACDVLQRSYYDPQSQRNRIR